MEQIQNSKTAKISFGEISADLSGIFVILSFICLAIGVVFISITLPFIVGGNYGKYFDFFFMGATIFLALGVGLFGLFFYSSFLVQYFHRKNKRGNDYVVITTSIWINSYRCFFIL